MDCFRFYMIIRRDQLLAGLKELKPYELFLEQERCLPVENLWNYSARSLGFDGEFTTYNTTVTDMTKTIKLSSSGVGEDILKVYFDYQSSRCVFILYPEDQEFLARLGISNHCLACIDFDDDTFRDTLSPRSSSFPSILQVIRILKPAYGWSDTYVDSEATEIPWHYLRENQLFGANFLTRLAQQGVTEIDLPTIKPSESTLMTYLDLEYFADRVQENTIEKKSELFNHNNDQLCNALRTIGVEVFN